MSLFASFGQGEFWGKGFAFASPVNDLLDRGDYTLSEIFDEDDLLQEIKAMNTRLIDFLSQESTIEEIVGFLVNPPPEGADDKRIHKYPYMACEVICCEVDAIVDALAGSQGGAQMERLFTILDLPGPLDDHISGYFEKVLFVLLKRKCLQLMSLINSGGLPLFEKFVRHLSNYSIMQMVERLILHQPGWDRDGSFSLPIGLDLGGGDEESAMHQSNIDLAPLRCAWAAMPEVVTLLVDQLLAGEGGDEEDEKAAATHTHVAELLLNVIENSVQDGAFVKGLMDKLPRLLELALPVLDLTADPEELSKTTLSIVVEERSSMLSALAIIEALLSRSQAWRMQWEMGQQTAAIAAHGLDGDQPTPPPRAAPPCGLVLGEEAMARLKDTLPLVKAYLKTHEVDTRTMVTQLKEPVPKLGMARLRLVRHVEALVKLCLVELDGPLEKEGVLDVCLDIFFKYEWTSVLHQAITRIVTWIMDAGPSRLSLQKYLVRDCHLLESILKATDENEVKEHPPEGGKSCRRGFMGYLIIMSQAIVEASRQSIIGPDGTPLVEDEEDLEDGSGEVSAGCSFQLFMLRELEPSLAERWAEYTQGKLAQATATQCHPLGGYPIPSRADENKLSTNFDSGPSGTDYDQVSDMLAQRVSSIEISGVTVTDEEGSAGTTDEQAAAWKEDFQEMAASALTQGPLGSVMEQFFSSDGPAGAATEAGFDAEEVVFTLADEKDPNYAWAAKAFAEPGTGGAGGGAGDAAGMASAFSAFGSGAAAGGWADFSDFDGGGGGFEGPSSSTSSRAPASGSGNTTTGGFDFGAFGSGLGEGSTTEPGATPPDFFTATIDFSSLKAGPAEGAGGGAGGDGFDDFFRAPAGVLEASGALTPPPTREPSTDAAAVAEGQLQAGTEDEEDEDQAPVMVEGRVDAPAASEATGTVEAGGDGAEGEDGAGKQTEGAASPPQEEARAGEATET